MISNERKGKLFKIVAIISQYIDLTAQCDSFVYEELIIKIQDLMNGKMKELTKDCTNEEKKFIQDTILESKNITFMKPEGLLYDENRTWFTDDKERDNSFFERYERYLKIRNHFSDKTLKSFSHDVLDPIMNQLGNPKATQSFGRYGLIVGDVQSGKTMNYIGMINKAADAGYKIIVVLTGTIETLRQQTQGRIDEGFTGFDSDTAIQKQEKLIGVGEDSVSKKGRKAASFTSKSSDFNAQMATSLGIAMDMLKIPVVIVAKKNVKILERITTWLKDNNTPGADGKINHPLLLIDDEADNASINTNGDDDEDPTKTNAAIRRLLFLFSKYTYIGYTATPFANVFIDPDIYKEDLGSDLFPRDFIFNLVPNEDYIGGKDIFLDDSKYKDALISNDDCGEVLPAKHKKYHPFESVPKTLQDALMLFALSNVIRDIRGDENTHRAMLVNISRYICMHGTIKDHVDDFFRKTMLGSYFTYGKTNDSDEIMDRTEALYNSEYAKSPSCKYTWIEIKRRLYDSNKDVMIVIVNSGSEMINYKEYANHGAKAVFVGGLSLSRGLTLEGLCISYFYRYSKTYDVLFQMGRWFGYRKNYDDLFRIFMPRELIGWYATITESMEQLRSDLIKMQKSGKKPIDFGIRVMNDSSKLKITSPSKMRTAATDYYKVIGFGEVIATPDIYLDTSISEQNIRNTMKLLAREKEMNGLKIETDVISGNKCIKGVSEKTVEDIVKSTTFSPANSFYDKKAVLDFLNRYKDLYFQKWDVVFVEGSKKATDNLYHIDELNLDIHKSKKRFDTYYNYLRTQGSKEQLNNPSDTSACLPSMDLKKQLDDEFVELYKRTHSDPVKKNRISAKQYLDTKDRNPLLMIYLIELSDAEASEREVKAIEDFENAGTVPFAIALGIPKYTDVIYETTVYKINIVEQRERRKKENIDDYYDDVDDITEEI